MADRALADDFLPVYDVSDAVATVAGADRESESVIVTARLAA